jgi:hypothetical protein
MGLIRGGLSFIAVVLLFFSFLAVNIFLTLSMSLDYDNVQPELFSVIQLIAEDEINLDDVVNERFEVFDLYCQNNSDSDYVFNEMGYTFVIPCEVVYQGPDAVVNKAIGNLVEEVYYKDYNCSFFDCLEKMDVPFFIVSAKAKDYWQSKLYFSMLSSLVLIGLMFLLFEQKFNLPVVVGILLILSSLPFMKLNWLLSFFSGSLYLQFFTIFFTKSYNVFLITFILGIIVLCFGLVLKFFNFGFWLQKFLTKPKLSFSKDNLVEEKSSKTKKNSTKNNVL